MLSAGLCRLFSSLALALACASACRATRLPASSKSSPSAAAAAPFAGTRVGLACWRGFCAAASPSTRARLPFALLRCAWSLRLRLPSAAPAGACAAVARSAAAAGGASKPSSGSGGCASESAGGSGGAGSATPVANPGGAAPPWPPTAAASGTAAAADGSGGCGGLSMAPPRATARRSILLRASDACSTGGTSARRHDQTRISISVSCEEMRRIHTSTDRYKGPDKQPPGESLRTHNAFTSEAPTSEHTDICRMSDRARQHIRQHIVMNRQRGGTLCLGCCSPQDSSEASE